MDANESSIGARFEKLKIKFSLSNSDLGKIAGVSHQAIGDIINGVTDNPKIGLLVKISNHLQVNLNWLAKGEGEMLESSSKNYREEPKSNSDVITFLMNQLVEKDNTIRVLLGKSGSVSSAGYGVGASFFGAIGLIFGYATLS